MRLRAGLVVMLLVGMTASLRAQDKPADAKAPTVQEQVEKLDKRVTDLEGVANVTAPPTDNGRIVAGEGGVRRLALPAGGTP